MTETPPTEEVKEWLKTSSRHTRIIKESEAIENWNADVHSL